MAKIPTKITARIEYWESKGLSKMRSTESKVYKETVKKLTWLVNSKYMFAGKKYTMPDFRLAVDRHALQVKDPNYFPFDKTKIKTISLNKFLYNPLGPSTYHSPFMRCLEHHPLPTNLTDAKHYHLILNSYIKASGNGYKTADDLSSIDHYNIAKIAKKLGSFYKRIDPKVIGGVYNSQKTIVLAFLEAAKSLTKYDPTKFSTSLLTRSWVWEKFPDYLAKNGYLAPKKPFNQYDY